jgi:hypothetical protein
MGARYAEVERSLPVPFGYGAIEHCDIIHSGVERVCMRKVWWYAYLSTHIDGGAKNWSVPTLLFSEVRSSRLR